MSNKKKSIQKFTWKQYKVYETFEEANKARQSLLKDNDHVKVRRCGPAGTKYKVKIGSPIQKPKAEKGAKDASK